jgi:hypothetical protein
VTFKKKKKKKKKSSHSLSDASSSIFLSFCRVRGQRLSKYLHPGIQVFSEAATQWRTEIEAAAAVAAGGKPTDRRTNGPLTTAVATKLNYDYYHTIITLLKRIIRVRVDADMDNKPTHTRFWSLLSSYLTKLKKKKMKGAFFVSLFSRSGGNVTNYVL